MNTAQEALGLLGKKVQDRVTNLDGVVTSISFDLYGCVQALVRSQPKDMKDYDTAGVWFDTKRLKVLSSKPVMVQPDFLNVAGPENKPTRGQA